MTKAERFTQFCGPEVLEIVDLPDPHPGPNEVHALSEIGELIESGRFSLPVVLAFPLTEIAEAHRVGEEGHERAKLVLIVG